jgi:hypothetical protein
VIRYRLDQAIVFGLRTAGKSFTLWRLDPCSVSYAGTTSTGPGQHGSKWYQWNDYKTLLRYIAAIHSAEVMRDHTIKYVPGGGQMWEIRVKDVQYRVHPFLASHPLGRMTRVGIAYPTTWIKDEHNTISIQGGELSGPAFIKISYVSTNSRFREEELYEQAHSQGYIPGLARLVAHETRSFFVQGEHGWKQKEVVVLGSGGEPLNQCKTVKELLMATYDTIESKSYVFLFSAAYLNGSPGGDGEAGCFASGY